MHSSIINKIEKARAYAEQKDRVLINSINVSFRGNHDEYPVSYDHGVWSCPCAFFQSHTMCSHTMALERMLEGMLPKEAGLQANG